MINLISLTEKDKDDLLTDLDNFTIKLANKITFNITADSFTSACNVVDKILDKYSGKNRIDIVVTLSTRLN